ncbi:hypothetical protein TNCV_77901 [Trichonephila clavipes]|nr:hypothetical protein TNCV_77901 [Trichonephila clavipes]
MVLKANDRRTSCPCHDEFRGPRSDYVRQVALATTTVCWFSTEKLLNWSSELVLKLGKTPKETYEMLVRVYEDQALFMKCMYEWFTRFRKAGKVFLTTPVAKDWRLLSVTKTLRK